ncbi:MAG: sigma-70 family RNA polymerase sigma factor [Ilumatobacteraceae bacterium]
MSTGGLLAAAVTAEPIDPDALVSELFATEGRSLVRLARIFCDDQAAAEDLVQEAFIRLHRSAGSIRDLSRTPAFLRSIVINLARDHNRRGLMSLRHRAATEPSPQIVSTPEDDAVADEQDQFVLAAVRLLPDRQRTCVVLRYYLEYTESETAETLGISKNSVKTHCRRALASLESAMEAAR